MSRAGVGLALIVCLVAVALYAPLFLKVSQQLERHVETGPDDFKAVHSTDLALRGQHDHAR